MNNLRQYTPQTSQVPIIGCHMLEPDTLQHEEDDAVFLRKFAAYKRYKLEGRGREEVAKEFGVTVRTVNRWADDVSAHLREAGKQEVDTLRATLTSRWNHVYSLAMDGYERSQRKKVETTIKVKPVEAPTEGEKPPEPVAEKTTKESEQSGSPAFLSVACDCLKAVGTLWAKEMDAADHRSGASVRVAGMSQRQQIEAQIKRLKDQVLKLGLNGKGGDGDRA